jgi:hypothetical protein
MTACGGPSASEAFDDAIKATCQKAFDCMSTFPSGQGITFDQEFGSSESICETMYSGAATDTKAKLEASISAGRITYNSDDAQVCIDGVKNETCGQFWGTDTYTPPPECDTAFQGTVADGGTCTIDDDCATSGSSCTTTTMTCGQG